MKPLKPVNSKQPKGKPAVRKTFPLAHRAAMSSGNRRAFARLDKQANP
jgi:hypothetical protein